MKKLDAEKVLVIYSDNDGTYKEIAKRYGVSASCVTHIKTGERHSDITGAGDSKNNRRKIKHVGKAQVQAVVDFMKEEPRTKEDAAIYFSLPLYTIRRILKDYTKKYKIKNV